MIVFFLWTYGIDELDKFIAYLNGCHNSIKFEVNYSTDKVCFLDTVTSIVDNVIHTTIYTKPTDKKQYLFFNSSHPKHTAKAIPYSQALRYRRIIDNDDLLHSELTTLVKTFMNRGYPVELLESTVDRVKLLTRDSVLKYKDKSTKKESYDEFLRGRSFLPLILPFHQSLESFLSKQLSLLWNDLINCDEKIKNIFESELPQIVFKRGVTIGSLLTGTKCLPSTYDLDRETVDILKSLELENACHNVNPCNKALCQCCTHICSTSEFFNTDRNKTFLIKDSFNCNSKDIIYIISCLKCNLLYVGQTARMLKERLNNHRSDIKLKKPTAISFHFNEPGHSIKDLKITPVAFISHLSALERANCEFKYMSALNSLYPFGLNNYPIIK